MANLSGMGHADTARSSGAAAGGGPAVWDALPGGPALPLRDAVVGGIAEPAGGSVIPGCEPPPDSDPAAPPSVSSAFTAVARCSDQDRQGVG